MIDDIDDVAHWRERAERAEGRISEAEARILELSEQVAVLSRMLFGRSSEKTGGAGAGDQPGAGFDGRGVGSAGGQGGQAGKRGQRPGSRGHGRRDYSHLDTREEIHDVPAGARACAGCGVAFEALDSQTSCCPSFILQMTASSGCR